MRLSLARGIVSYLEIVSRNRINHHRWNHQPATTFVSGTVQRHGALGNGWRVTIRYDTGRRPTQGAYPPPASAKTTACAGALQLPHPRPSTTKCVPCHARYAAVASGAATSSPGCTRNTTVQLVHFHLRLPRRGPHARAPGHGASIVATAALPPPDAARVLRAAPPPTGVSSTLTSRLRRNSASSRPRGLIQQLPGGSRTRKTTVELVLFLRAFSSYKTTMAAGRRQPLPT